MKLEQFDIFLARVQFEKCLDVRPCLIIYPPAGRSIKIVRLSSQMTLFDRGNHFRLDPSNPDFPGTGLRRESYICGDKVDTIASSQLRTKVGSLGGELRSEFVEWFGM